PATVLCESFSITLRRMSVLPSRYLMPQRSIRHGGDAGSFRSNSRKMPLFPDETVRPRGGLRHCGTVVITNCDHTIRSTIRCLISAMALAGFSPLGQVLVQFMIAWQR